MDQRKVVQHYKDEFLAEYKVVTNKNIFDLHQAYKDEALKIIKKYPAAFLRSYFWGIIDMYFSVNRQFWARAINNYNKKEFDAIKAIKSDKIKGLIKVIRDYNTSTLIYSFTMIGWFLFCYTLTIIGIIKLIKIKEIVWLALLLVPILYFTMITGQAGLARFKMPIIPFYSILAALGFSALNVRLSKLFPISLKTHQEEFGK